MSEEKAPDRWTLCQLKLGDAPALAEFYNTLSEQSRRTFRPLGWNTSRVACETVVQANQPPQTSYDLVAWEDTHIVGWSFVWHLDSAKPVFGLGIADVFQGQGHGSVLMDLVLATARQLGVGKLYLTVVQDNSTASRMYERRGFVRYGELVGDDGLAYLKMVAQL